MLVTRNYTSKSKREQLQMLRVKLADAVEDMQSYLELVPNAPDAQAARDQIDLWQLKAKEHKPAQPK